MRNTINQRVNDRSVYLNVEVEAFCRDAEVILSFFSHFLILLIDRPQSWFVLVFYRGPDLADDPTLCSTFPIGNQLLYGVGDDRFGLFDDWGWLGWVVDIAEEGMVAWMHFWSWFFMGVLLKIGVLFGTVDCGLFVGLGLRGSLLVFAWLIMSWIYLSGCCTFIVLETCLFLSASDTAHNDKKIINMKPFSDDYQPVDC